ncbi:MAG: Phage integrase [Frankiales bacterium]|nr:Phage integrase [Frankiales bacterium]
MTVLGARQRSSESSARQCTSVGLYASGLIASGCDVVAVQRALGHASANTTLVTYSHLWPYADNRTRAAVEHLMAAALQDRADLVRTSVDPQAADLRK